MHLISGAVSTPLASIPHPPPLTRRRRWSWTIECARCGGGGTGDGRIRRRRPCASADCPTAGRLKSAAILAAFAAIPPRTLLSRRRPGSSSVEFTRCGGEVTGDGRIRGRQPWRTGTAMVKKQGAALPAPITSIVRKISKAMYKKCFLCFVQQQGECQGSKEGGIASPPFMTTRI